ncbi:MAG: NAD-dependent epimerase/dehydratase family protein [Planctomycetes bacterium]|nr:NAD-dependent epimerase/dehydratase family protein [Planctomycetota bacterium]
MSTSILVTGANGFLGRYVVEQHVARGDRVRALVRRDDVALRNLGVEQHVADLRDADGVIAACRGIEVVQHVAGLAGIWGPWRDYYDVNVRGTEHVLAGCRRHGVGRLVFTSSPSVTFDGRSQEGIDESAPYAGRWLCHYPHSKALAEQQVLAAAGSDLRTCSLRPHLIWGPRDQHLVPRLLDRARRGQLRRIGNGANRIDTIYVENAAEAQLLAADALTAKHEVSGQAYFISQDEPVNCWGWIDELLAIAGLPPVQKSLGLGMAWRIGTVLETIHKTLCIRREPRMTRFLAAQLGVSHYFDITRAKRDLAYRPRVSMAEGMQRLADTM